jgi:hypothetical protein
MGFGQCVEGWFWCAYVSPVLESVRCLGAFCFAMLWRAGVHVCGERHVMGDIGNLGSVLGGSAGVEPSGEV